MELICPKCQGLMRQYERNGVTIDQCTECRGLFLDRGELERLTDAERGWHGQPDQRRQEHHHQDQRHQERRYEQPRYEEHGRYDDRHHSDYGRRKKRGSFLEGLFDD